MPTVPNEKIVTGDVVDGVPTLPEKNAPGAPILMSFSTVAFRAELTPLPASKPPVVQADRVVPDDRAGRHHEHVAGIVDRIAAGDDARPCTDVDRGSAAEIDRADDRRTDQGAAGSARGAVAVDDLV